MKKTSRNDPCPCGSGKKYKQCCLQRDETLAASKVSETASIHEAIHAALEHHQAGRLPQAEAIYRQILQQEPNHPDALHLLGVIALHEGKPEVAAELINKAIRVKPSSPMYSNLGIALKAQGKLAEAVESYRRALALQPDYAEAHSNLGNALHEYGKPDEAVESYRRALALKPDYAEAHNNLGNALHDHGKLDEAVESYRRALALKPDYVEAHSNLGVVLHAQGKLDEAVESYRRALALKPDYAEAHSNLGIALKTQGKLDEAVESYLQALKLRESHETKIGFAQCIKDISFTREITGIRPLVIQAISEPWGRPGELVAPSISLIKLNQDIKECIDRATNAWPARLSGHELFGPSGRISIFNDQLLHCLLENAPICTVAFERFLTMVRLTLLDAIMTEENPCQAEGVVSSVDQEEKGLSFYCALARQCFINEYVFACNDEEIDHARLLRDQLAAALKTGSPIPVLWLVVVAAYFPLFSLPSVETLLDQSWPESVSALLMQQVREPMEELQLRADIPRLTIIEGDVSSQVQQQYEENPYPRWVKVLSGSKANTVDVFLRLQFPFSSFKPIGKYDKVDILIAGCGTGQQSIETAQMFRGCHVLAVDLSLSSLSYAKRKTRELGLKNIEYAHADIMKLGAIDRSFDVIESVGVLHHMADPMAGWHELVSLLRPGGLMRLGFYSELGRQHIVAARNFIAERGYASNIEDIRRCRQDLMAMENDMQFRQLTSTSDFYGTSACRDLIFHVQEHRYTLPQIKKYLGELGLDFIGFSLEPYVMEQYRKRFTDDPSQTNLDYWSVFEAENPNTFTRMYQFWVQKHG